MLGDGNVLPELAAAGLWSTPSDLARFLLTLAASKRGARGALLAPATTAEMFAPVDGFGYGLGGALRGSGPGQRQRPSPSCARRAETMARRVASAGDPGGMWSRSR